MVRMRRTFRGWVRIRVRSIQLGPGFPGWLGHRVAGVPPSGHFVRGKECVEDSAGPADVPFPSSEQARFRVDAWRPRAQADRPDHAAVERKTRATSRQSLTLRE